MLGQCIIILCALTVSVFAGDAPYEGYIVKLTDTYFSLFSLDNNSAGIMVVETLAETELIPPEHVEYIEPNYIVELFGDTKNSAAWLPNDPYYQDYQHPLQAINGLTPFRVGLTGKGVKVGFVDSGINVAHEDLSAQNIAGTNFHSDGLPYNEDCYGHGTFSAGILATQTHNNVGLCGMAPDVQIMAYRAFSKKSTTMSCVVNAIDQAIADGCQIINLSLGLSSESITLKAAITRAIDSGVIVIAAVGNDGTDTLQYPAAYTGVIGVGSVSLINDDFVVSDFSQRNNSVFVTAPGEAIAGLGHTDVNSYHLDLTSASNSGTSYAAPVVSALAALALDYDEDITVEGIRYLLQTTAQDKGVTGYDTAYGYGVVDPTAFLAELQREFSISYELCGGQMQEHAPDTYKVSDNTIDLSVVPYRDGYLFQGWYEEEECITVITEIAAGSLGDITLYAGWIKAPDFVCMTEAGQLQINAQQDFEDIVLLQSTYDTFGQMRFCRILIITLMPGDNLFDVAPIQEGSDYSVFFLLDSTFRPLAISFELLNVPTV